ncbi:MAG: diadenylate cyclase CdaA [Planctomycetota bacterium]
MFDLVVLQDWRNIVQIAVLWIMLYWTLRYLETTIAGGFLRSLGLVGAVLILVLMALFRTFKLYILAEIFQYFVIFGFVGLIILFQHDLRHGLTRLGRSPFARFLRQLGVKAEEEGPSVAEEIMKAARRFSKYRVGSLIVLEREVTLQPFIDRGVRLDAMVRAELLDTIFSTPTLLHDGAAILRGDQLAAAGCVLPLTQNPRVPKRYGTRHRAAIGITEESDSVVIATSEETGVISIVINGEIHPQEDTVKAEELIDRLMAGGEIGDSA